MTECACRKGEAWEKRTRERDQGPNPGGVERANQYERRISETMAARSEQSPASEPRICVHCGGEGDPGYAVWLSQAALFNGVDRDGHRFYEPRWNLREIETWMAALGFLPEQKERLASALTGGGSSPASERDEDARCARCMEREREPFLSNRDPGDESDACCPRCADAPWATWVDSFGYLTARCLFGHTWRVTLLTPRQQREWPHGSA